MTSNCTTLTSRFLGIFLAASFGPAAFAQEVTPTALKDIEQEWRDRERQVQNAHFVWRETRVMELADDELRPSMEVLAKRHKPRNDRTTYRHEYMRDFGFDGSNYRHFSNLPVLAADGSGFRTPHPKQIIKDGVGRSMSEVKLAKTAPYQGIISKSDGDEIRSLACLRPMLLHFRPFFIEPNFFQQARLTNETARLEDALCIVIKRGNRQRLDTFWLDPELRMAVRRQTTHVDNNLRTQLDVRYALHDDSTVVPTSWNLISYYTNGVFENSFEAQVQSLSINSDLSPDFLQLEFPPGTLVTDRTRGDDGKPLQYIARPGGKERVILPEELRRVNSVQELIDTKTGQAGLQRSNRYWFFATVAAMAGCGLFFLLTYLRRRRIAG